MILFFCAFCAFLWLLDVSFRGLNCAARVYLREVPTIIARGVKIRAGIDAVANMCGRVCDRVVVEVRSSQRGFNGFCTIGFHAHTGYADSGGLT